ncbi:Subtilisin-like protease [Euphorbia peplus]|nr:Subtilisin-like protease [Euphorbia peplus]
MSLLNFLVTLAFVLSSCLIISEALVASQKNENMETYIVFLKKPAKGLIEDLDRWHQSFLPATANSGEQSPHLVHSYQHVVTGFAARLTSDDVAEMKNKDGFIAARRTRMVPLHTTHTPSLLGLQKDLGLWNPLNAGRGIIIGLIDSGIAADHPSFSAQGMPAPPSKWRGKCDNATLCNNKLIGARNFNRLSNDTSDDYMHGTHTASIAAGSPVEGASYFGQANGTAIGMAPLAHLAMYKVSGMENKAGEDEILAAMDAAIEDGVDVLSISLGSDRLPFYDDAIALGAFAAIQRGIFVSCSAGNDGPDNSSLSNEAPWILTVGASTVDRAIRATVLLGNNVEFKGASLFQPNDFPSTMVPLVYAGANGKFSSASCAPGTLKDTDVKGKIVLCERGTNLEDNDIPKGKEVRDNGGVAIIIMNKLLFGNHIDPLLHVLPASQVSYSSGSAIKAYINSTSSPTGTILFKGTVLGSQVLEAPQVALISSRGPSVQSPGILKPDIIGPGVRVLGAWPISVDNNTTNKFYMDSGTSMSCPHLSGVAALLKGVHPDWSPAAIKSAIMTTANLTNLGGKPISGQELAISTVFDMGAGHVNPNRANDPGLIYDIQPEDYIPYLCGLGYSDEHVGFIVQGSVVCSNDSSIPEAQLNYPSFSIKLGPTPKTYTRTVTNVGPAKSDYVLEIMAPQGVDVRVKPDEISFTRVNQTAKYSVTFSKKSNASGIFSEGFLYWMAEGHNVRSPIVVLFE